MIRVATDDVRAIRRAVRTARTAYRWLHPRRRLCCVSLAALQAVLVVCGWGLVADGVRTILGWGRGDMHETLTALLAMAVTGLITGAAVRQFTRRALRDRLERLEEDTCDLLAELNRARKRAHEARQYYQDRWQQLRVARDLARAQAMEAEARLDAIRDALRALPAKGDLQALEQLTSPQPEQPAEVGEGQEVQHA